MSHYRPVAFASSTALLSRRASNRDFAVGAAVALFAHVLGFYWASGLERSKPEVKQRTRVVQMDVKLPKKPKPKVVAEQKQPQLAPKPAPKPPPEKVAKQPKPARKKPAKKSKKRRKSKRSAKRAKPRIAKKTPPPRPTPQPVPLVLSKVYGGSGGVAVEKGDDDILGDPSVEVNERNRVAVAPQEVVENEDDDDDDEDEDDEVRTVIRHARPRSRCQVTWPTEAPVQRRIVSIRLLVTVNRKGKVSAARVLRSVGYPFDAAAVKALRACVFEPGTRDGQPFTDRVPFLVEFRPGAGA